MRSNQAVLMIERMNASPTISATVGKFLRYLHYRDYIQEGEAGNGVAGLVRYVAHRDRATPEGRLFSRNRGVGDYERRALLRFVNRSLAGLPADLLDPTRRRLPAAYRLVLSPEDSRGLDLRRLTRAVMNQLENDAGDLPPWIGAEHRNTAHPHIHIVMAARREIAPGQFRRIVVNRARLARMKARMSREIEVQRGDRSHVLAPEVGLPSSSRASGQTARMGSRLGELPRTRVVLERHDPFRRPHQPPRPHRHRGFRWYPMENAFARLAAHYRKEMEREEQEIRRRRFSGRDRGEEREWEVYE